MLMPVHPGRILKRELLARNLSANGLALALRVPSGRITGIAPGHWLRIFRARISSPAPEPRMRVMTKDKLRGVELSNAIPAHATASPRLTITLLGA